MTNPVSDSIFDRWLLRLRALVPARTMALYTSLTALYPAFWSASTDIPAVVPFIVIGLCLVAQVLLAILKDGKRWYHVLFSAGAFVLYGIVQPYLGILGVFEAGAMWYFIFTAIVIAYVTLIPMAVTDLAPGNR